MTKIEQMIADLEKGKTYDKEQLVPFFQAFVAMREALGKSRPMVFIAMNRSRFVPYKQKCVEAVNAVDQAMISADAAMEALP